jgi:hypothetical protein
MKKILFLLCIAFASVVITSCSKDDNPIYGGIDNIDNPQEQVTDQPANAPQR